MTGIISAISILVADYDEAIDFYCRALGFVLKEDTSMGNKRWVVVQPAQGGSALVLAKASTPAQQQCIGQQAAERVWLFLETDNFARDYAKFVAAGVHFLEAPRHESYATVAVFQDLYGNKWDLLQRNV